MKKILLTIFGFFALSASYAKYKVLGYTANGGGFFGYDFVQVSLATFQEGGVSVSGWDVKCRHSGWHSCPRYGSSFLPYVEKEDDGWDDVQEMKVEELMTYAFEQMESGEKSEGTYSITVQVSGEDFMRVYEVKWKSGGSSSSITNIDATDNNGINSSEVDIEITRDDVIK